MLKHFASNLRHGKNGSARFVLVVAELACLMGATRQSLAAESQSQPPEEQAQLAQEGAEGSRRLKGAHLEEVVVTANRVSAQSLQEIPMAVSSLSAEDLNSKGLVTMQDFLRSVPGVSLDSNQPGLNRILMRGMVATGFDPTAIQDRSLVAVYLDDIPITLNTSNPDLRVADLERVEVIRGPQGTLYGAGSMAGTVRYVTKKPDPRAFSGLAEAQTSTTKGGGVNWNLRGSANLPLVADRMALRLGVFQEDVDGYIDNIGTGQKDANATTSTQGSAALRWLANDALTVDATMVYQNLDNDGTNIVYRELGDRYTSTRPVGFHDDLRIYNLTLTYDAGPAKIISSTSYLDRDFQFVTSFDFFIADLLGEVVPAPSVQLNSVDNFTQEIRAIFGEGERLRWQVGAYYGRDKRRYTQHTFAFGMDDLLGIDSRDLSAPNRDEIYFGSIPTEDKQQALFGEGTFDVTDKLAVTAGLRYFEFEGPASFSQGGLAGTDAEGMPISGEATEKADGFNPKLNLSYQVSDDLMVFAEAARGFRYGGVNYPVPESFCAADLAADGLTSAPLTFGPDRVWSYSLGEKWSSSDRRALVNATAFYIKWSDAQTLHVLPCGYSFFENAAELTSQGVELETQFRFTPAFVFAVNAAYTDATADQAIPTIEARAGDRVPFFPEWTATAAAEYSLPVRTGDITFSAEYSYRSSMNTDFNPTLPTARTVPSSSIVNAAVNFIAGPWQFGIFGTNLTDREQISQVDSAGALAEPGDPLYVGRPRTIGLRLQREFGDGY